MEDDLYVVVSTEHESVCPSAEALKTLITHVLDSEGASWDSVGVILADHTVVTDLNSRYLNHDYDTDVLSFRLDDGGPIEGEVYVDVETAVERCSEFDVAPADEIRRYAVHGVLHLIGYDDSTEMQEKAMRGLEDKYLAL